MNWLQRLPKTIRSASGTEWGLWRKLPWIAVAGTALPLLCLTVLHLMADAQSSEAHARWLQMANFMAGAIIVFHWTMVLTVAIGCIIVMVMKGPGYVADGYRVSHSDAPREQPESSVEAAYYRKHPSAPHSSEAFDPATNVKNT